MSAEMIDFGDLPEAFSVRNPDGSFVHVKKPCYRFLAPQFLGVHNEGTFYDESEIAQYEGVPNEHMEPLNKAAAARLTKWLESLPTAGATINVDDLAEAAVMIANAPELAKMSKEEISAATVGIATKLKKKRDTASGMILPPMAGPSIFTKGSGQKAPPMGATRYLDNDLRGPGLSGQRGVVHEPALGEATVKRQPQMSASSTR